MQDHVPAKNTGQPSLPDEPYMEVLTAALIKPNPEVISILKKLHFELITPKFVDECLQLVDAEKNREDGLEVPPMHSENFKVYKELVEQKGLMPDALLIELFEKQHMRRLDRVLAREAYKKCLLAHNQAKINRRKERGQL